MLIKDEQNNESCSVLTRVPQPAGCCAPDGPRHKARRPLACMGATRTDKAKEALFDVFNHSLSEPASQLVPTVACRNINIALSRPGGYCGVAAPVPFPNTAVKRPCANGTSSQDAGE